MSSKELQDKYMRNKIESWVKEYDLPIEQILAAHRGGITDPEKASAKYKQYVKEGLEVYNK